MNKETMNKIVTVTFSILFAAVAAFGDALSPEDLGCIDAREVINAGGRLEPGQWYLDWKTCKDFADANGMPVLFIWSNKTCVHCKYTDLTFVQDSFKDWAAKNNAGKVIYCFMAGGESKYPDQQNSAGYNWMWYGGGTQLNAFPFVVLWWKAKSVNQRYTGDNFCSGNATGVPFNATTHLNDKSLPDRVANVIAKMESAFKGWSPVTYAGGYFLETQAPYNRLEAEKSTTTVSIDVTREATAAMSQMLRISAPGKTAQTQTLSWAKDEKKKTVTIPSFKTAWFAEGKAVTLELLDEGKAMSTTTIACVTPANSTGNPDFKGCADFGQWTMDLDAAKTKVNGTGGDAWTLVCAQGSLWCPDCGRVEKNFLGAKDASGNNKFAAWAKSKNIALVTVDIPNFNAANVDCESPCLLKKDAYTTDPEGSGTKTAHSGLGYLTRKMVSDADAKAMLTRNWELASKMTSEGGFNRPEERDYKGRTYRCGAPIFVLLDKSGKVRAELVRLAEVSPTDTSNYDNYIKRFEEMIDIAKNNATEIENNYASPSGSITISASGVEKARLCNADMYDTFKVGGNAKQRVVVKGDSSAGFDADCEVTVEFQKLENGKAVTLGTAKSDTLKAGVTQEYTFTSGGTYYVQVRGWGPKTDATSRSAGYNSSAFVATSSTANHFQNYTLTLTTILKPQEDKGTYAYAAETGKVSMDLVQGTLYRITGMASCPSQLTDKGNDLYEAKATATAVITLPASAGTLEYQIWKPGSLGFTQTARTVARSVCDADGKALQIKVSRTDGKSGAASATVSVNPNGTTIADKNRYWLTKKSDGHEHSDAVEKVGLTWADGDTADKTVYLYIDDDQSWDGFGMVTLKVAVNGGEATIAEGQEAFRLSVLPEVIEAPGKVVLTRADPAIASKKIYAEVGTKVKIWLERTDGFDGQVAGILQSSVAGVKFAVANPRDLVRLADSDPKLIEKYGRRYGADAQLLYWASSEGGEKYVEVTGVPAGETAKITFTPIGELKGGKLTATIVSVATDAPRFETDVCELTGLYRYTAVSETIKILKTTGNKVQVKKLSGKIPSGLKVAYDENAKAMTLTGVPTKAGAFDAIYQVIETRNGKKIEGLTVLLDMLVRDLVTGEPGGKPVNPSIAKSRTFKSIPAYRTEGDKRTGLAGLLQMTVPPTGKASAKFTGPDGTTSFSAKSWSGVGLDGKMEVTLTDKKYGRTLIVEVEKDGSIGAELAGDEDVNGCVAVCDGKVWSKANPATDWKGYYTVALKNKGIISEDAKGVAPTGDGYLTLKMDTDSVCNSGTFKVAGKLPNGTAVSCSMVLSREDDTGVLPIFKTASKDTLAAAVVITPNAEEYGVRRCVTSEGLFDGYWLHDDKAGASYAVNFGLYGSYYDKNEDLGGCCAEFFGKTDLMFYVEKTDIADIKVGTDTIKVTDARESKLTCKLARATGIVTGNFTHPELGTSVSYAGIVVNGWGDECGCGPADVYLPFVSGSYQYTEDGLKCGGVIGINK